MFNRCHQILSWTKLQQRRALLPSLLRIPFAPWVALVLAFGFAPNANAALIGNWTGDGNANDSVAGRNGTLVNGTGFDSGKFGQAFRLDGTDDFVSVPDDNAWTFGGDFTLALWVNFDTIRPGGLGGLPNVFIGHDQGGGPQPKWVFVQDGGGQMAFHIHDGVNQVFLTAPTPFFPVVDNWHHVAMTRSGNTYSFFADGTSLGSAVSALGLANASASLTFGQAEGLGFLDGRLDDLRIYDSALSPSEISALIPEPGAISLLVIGASFLIRRRR